MSDFPGEMTKQIFVAPPSTSRSTRYSLTARGRSRSPSRRLPTGSSSFEKASGCILLPCPAAGTMPHIGIPHDPFEFLRAHVRRVAVERAFHRADADSPALRVVHVEC